MNVKEIYSILDRLAARKVGKQCWYYLTGESKIAAIRCSFCDKDIFDTQTRLDHSLFHMKEFNLLPFI